MFRRKTTSQAEQENNEAALREAKVKTFHDSHLNWFLKDPFFTDLNDPQIKEVKTLIGELSGRSSLYCSDPCLKRYLEARNWNVGKAKKMLEETLKWRSTFKPEEIRWVSHQTHLGFLLWKLTKLKRLPLFFFLLEWSLRWRWDW